MLKFELKLIKKSMIFAGAAAAVLLVSVGIWAYKSPYMYVSMDVNPSIEFTVNRFNRVIGVKAVNNDGNEILQELSAFDVSNASIKNAILSVLEQITEEGYFEGDMKGGIVIATSGQNMQIAGELAEELQQIIELNINNNGENVEVESFSVDQDSVNEAQEMGVTPGKLKLVRILEEAAKGRTDINEKDWLAMPVKDIIAAIGLYINSIEADASDNATSTNVLEEDGQASLLSNEQSKDDDADEFEDKNDDADEVEGKNDDADEVEDKNDDANEVEDQNYDANEDEDQYNDTDEDEDKNDDADDDEDRYYNDEDEDSNADDNNEYSINNYNSKYDDDEDQDDSRDADKDRDEDDENNSDGEQGED